MAHTQLPLSLPPESFGMSEPLDQANAPMPMQMTNHLSGPPHDSVGNPRMPAPIANGGGFRMANNPVAQHPMTPTPMHNNHPNHIYTPAPNSHHFSHQNHHTEYYGRQIYQPQYDMDMVNIPQKRARPDNNQSIRQYRRVGTNIFTMHGELVDDMAHVIEDTQQVQAETIQQLTKTEAMLSTINLRIEQLEELTKRLENVGDNLGSPNGSPNGSPKARKEQNGPVIKAVRAASRALLGVNAIRVEGEERPVILYPHPLAEGDPEREDPKGNRLWNPLWLVPQPAKHEYNIRFINAMTSTVINNARADNSAYEIPQQDLDQPKVIQKAAKQHFTTMTKNYKKQNILEAKVAEAKKGRQARYDARKSAKFSRRSAAIPAMERRHNITGLAGIVRKDCMSSEHDEPDDEDERTQWRKDTKCHLRNSQKGIDIVQLQWRVTQLSKLYYALDKISFDPQAAAEIGLKGVKTVLIRVHGLPESANPSPPPTKPTVPQYLVNKKWLNKKENELTLTGREPAPLWWDTLDIQDEEVDADDLEAIEAWEADDEDSERE
ncbi:hypothetical protein B0H34DRAFT_803120 [Crassisporium funariophilum]|nr:hypothetical protein B0H34DRAFT_803120 [Crassisporium funariophilum]